MAHDLLNQILKASEKLSGPELQMLEDVARRLKENAGKGQGLLVKDDINRDEVLDPDILAKKI